MFVGGGGGGGGKKKPKGEWPPQLPFLLHLYSWRTVSLCAAQKFSYVCGPKLFIVYFHCVPSRCVIWYPSCLLAAKVKSPSIVERKREREGEREREREREREWFVFWRPQRKAFRQSTLLKRQSWPEWGRKFSTYQKFCLTETLSIVAFVDSFFKSHLAQFWTRWKNN